MHEIKCPSCGKTFKVDETSYAAILSQVHTQEFDEEIQAKTCAEVAGFSARYAAGQQKLRHNLA